MLGLGHSIAIAPAIQAPSSGSLIPSFDSPQLWLQGGEWGISTGLAKVQPALGDSDLLTTTTQTIADGQVFTLSFIKVASSGSGTIIAFLGQDAGLGGVDISAGGSFEITAARFNQKFTIRANNIADFTLSTISLVRK